MAFPGDWGRFFEATTQTAEVSGSHTDFPVYFDLANAPSGFWNRVQDDGGDIRVTDANDNLIPHEVSFIDAANKQGSVWCNLASLDDQSETTVRVYYDNANASTLAVTDANGRNAVWSNGYLGVWMFEALSGDVVDHTGNGLSGTVIGSPTRGVSGKAGNAYDFNRNDFVEVTHSGELAGMDNLTLSIWANGPSQTDSALLAANKPYEIIFDSGKNTGGNNIWWALDNGEDWVINATSISYTPSAWHRWDLVSDLNADEVRIHRDGSVGETNPGTGPINPNTNPVGFGQRPDGFLKFTGKIAFATISDKARSIDWVATEHANQNNPAAFWSVSSEQAGSFSVLLTPLTTGTPTVGVFSAAISSRNYTLTPITSPSPVLPTISAAATTLSLRRVSQTGKNAPTTAKSENAATLMGRTSNRAEVTNG